MIFRAMGTFGKCFFVQCYLFISVLRDTTEHDRDIDSVLSQYTNFVKPAFEDFTLPVSATTIFGYQYKMTTQSLSKTVVT